MAPIFMAHLVLTVTKGPEHDATSGMCEDVYSIPTHNDTCVCMRSSGLRGRVLID